MIPALFLAKKNIVASQWALTIKEMCNDLPPLYYYIFYDFICDNILRMLPAWDEGGGEGCNGGSRAKESFQEEG